MNAKLRKVSVARRRTAARIAGGVFVAWIASHVSLAGEVDFNTQIRPILSQACLRCHGPDDANREAEFRIDTRADATRDLGGRAGIVAGKPNQSEVLRRVTADDPDERMPPPDQGDGLNPKQVELLRRWIAEGAPYENHWAFVPIRKPEVPRCENAPHDATDIDRFIVAALEAKGLQLSPRIAKAALIRRATFDLIGLPPTWQEVRAFEEDHSADAFAQVIDRLLDSPRYGERWGRHWLDLARYADTHGGGAIGFQTFPFSYTYRDYVVDAFNRDLPYDRFVLEQIAADQLGLEPNHPSLAALGFLTIGRQYPNRHDRVDDRIDVITRGLMGLTVACARCHDHKFDPIPTTDYYSLYATLGSSDVPERLPVIGDPAETDSHRSYNFELDRLQQRHDEMVREQSEVLRHRLRMQVGLYLRELAKGTAEQDLSTVFLSYRTDDLRPLMIERWRKHLAQRTIDDPVFGAWHRLSQLQSEQFAQESDKVVAALVEQNGEFQKAAPNLLATEPPRWNPRVLTALKAAAPKSMLDVADAYGLLFAKIQEEWLTGLSKASLEARPDTPVVPDEDVRHAEINSAVDRQLRFHLYGPDSPTAISDDLASTLLNRPIRDHVSGLHAAIHNLHLTSPGAPPRAMVLEEAANPGDFFVFRRGNPLDRGAAVLPRFVSQIGNSTPFPDGHRRLGLARAIVDPANPLTRRVIVNWVWQRHFGLGLVRTPDDLGVRGDPPTHPQLLDYLAESLSDTGWSLKQLHRRIMLSQVYQQAAVENAHARQLDPQNRFLWRMPRRRLEMEAMRDAMLAVAGQLDTSMGGRSFDLFAEPFIHRRSIYGFVNRDVVPGFFSTFDMADPSVCVAKRPETTVPQQTLFALNSKFIQEQAQHLGDLKEVRMASSDQERVNVLYQRAFSRSPTPDEITLALQYVQSSGSDGSNNDAWRKLAHVLLAANEFVFLD